MSVEDIKVLLTQENPFLSKLEDDAHAQAKNMGTQLQMEDAPQRISAPVARCSCTSDMNTLQPILCPSSSVVVQVPSIQSS